MLNILALLVGILTAALGLNTGTATTASTTSTATATSTSTGQPGDPCDPETYTGPYRCVEDPNSDSGYAIAN